MKGARDEVSMQEDDPLICIGFETETGTDGSMGVKIDQERNRLRDRLSIETGKAEESSKTELIEGMMCRL